LFDSSSHLTHFTGWMLEEEIVASLWGSTSSATHETFSTRPFLFNVDKKFWGRREF
jgi:hypothetical protein